MTIIVNQEHCTGCGICIKSCPADAVIITEHKAKIDHEKCYECCRCIDDCPEKAISIQKKS